MVLTVFHGVEHPRTEAMTATNGGRTPEKTSSGAVPVGNPAWRRLRLHAGLSCRVTLLRTIKSPMTRRKMRIYRAMHSGAFKCQRSVDEREDDHAPALTDD
jgi:hypothetical protein